MTAYHICIEQRGPRAKADARVLGGGGRFIRAHQGPALVFPTAETAIVAGSRAQNRISGAGLSTLAIWRLLP